VSGAATTFSVRFLGCKVSQADAALIRDALRDAGHVETTAEAADVHVVNTCALTVEAERKSRREANRGARRGRVFVSGCAVNLNAGQFAGAGVTTLPGSADRAAAEIVELLGGGRITACADDAPRAPGRTRAFLKVQNGCDSECAFCIIPTTRGRAESRPLARILAEGRRRIDEGHPELVLTGINIGTFRDPGSGADLADLVRAVGRLEGLERLRVSSIEPGDVGERLLAAMAETPVVAPHLHVPLQSGDPGVLRAMRRSYGVGDYLDACRRARATLPGLNLTTDAIVGFPGEDEGAFLATARIAEELEMSKVHVFPYSPRPGTDAAAMDGRPPPDELRERARRLRDLSDRLGFAHRSRRVGGRDRVLVERRHPDGTLGGLGADYSRFVLPAEAGEPGDMVAVAVEGVAGEHLAGRPL
jgi:threonylcarbamoyladenosine tRNA methylthiotransferase MtaB